MRRAPHHRDHQDSPALHRPECHPRPPLPRCRLPRRLFSTAARENDTRATVVGPVHFLVPVRSVHHVGLNGRRVFGRPSLEAPTAVLPNQRDERLQRHGLDPCYVQAVSNKTLAPFPRRPDGRPGSFFSRSRPFFHLNPGPKIGSTFHDHLKYTIAGRLECKAPRIAISSL
jgi:hypothetical protein